METIIAETTTAYKSLSNQVPRRFAPFKAFAAGAEYPILMNYITERGVLNSFSISRPERLIGELNYREAIRQAKVRSLRGKYAFVPTSSEVFALRKQAEIQREG
jgi:hypothetical protein